MAQPFLHRGSTRLMVRSFPTTAAAATMSLRRGFASISTSTSARCTRCLLRRPIRPRPHNPPSRPPQRQQSPRHKSTSETPTHANPADDPNFVSPLDAAPRYVRKPRRHRWAGLVFMAAMPLTAFALGTWQIQRLQWKTALIARLEDNLVRPPLPLPPRVDPAAVDAFDHRRVAVRGVWDHAREMLVGPRMRDGEEGLVVVTPLVRRGVRQMGLRDEDGVGPRESERVEGSGGGWGWGWLGSWFARASSDLPPATGEVENDADTILVIRGWIPKDKRDQKTRPEGLPEGVVRVEGLLRRPFRKNMFTPANAPGENKWYFLDLAEMSQWADTAPIWVEESMDPTAIETFDRMRKGLPLGKNASVELNNNHLQYIFTWYALSAATSVMLWMLIKKPPTDVQRKVRATKGFL